MSATKSQPKTEVCMFRVTPAELMAIDSTAHLFDESRTEYCRRAVLGQVSALHATAPKVKEEKNGRHGNPKKASR